MMECSLCGGNGQEAGKRKAGKGMVRIQVIKASKLAVIAAAVVLCVVLALMLVSMAGAGDDRSAHSSAETVAAFSQQSLPLAPGATREAGGGGLMIEIVTPAPTMPQADKKRILIYHTHTYEAYRQVEEDRYEETETWRTADHAHSVVRVGEALAQLLTNAGYEVVHDVTNHELPELKYAYTRSLETLEGYEEEFDLYIDLHRDAYVAGARESVLVNGQALAPLMLMVGKGENYQDKPDFEGNYAFAARVTQAINQKADGLCRDVLVRTGRYNQHIGTPAVLIEVGHNENTLQQALGSIPYLADGIAGCLEEMS